MNFNNFIKALISPSYRHTHLILLGERARTLHVHATCTCTQFLALQFLEHRTFKSGMFNNDFIANLQMSAPVKEFLQLVSTCRSYGQQSTVLCSRQLQYAFLCSYYHLDIAECVYICSLKLVINVHCDAEPAETSFAGATSTSLETPVSLSYTGTTQPTSTAVPSSVAGKAFAFAAVTCCHYQPCAIKSIIQKLQM